MGISELGSERQYMTLKTPVNALALPAGRRQNKAVRVRTGFPRSVDFSPH